MLHLVKRYSRKHQLNQYLTSDILTCSLKFDGLPTLSAGTIFVRDAVAYKVSFIDTATNGLTTVFTVAPKLDEVFSDLKFSGYITAAMLSAAKPTESVNGRPHALSANPKALSGCLQPVLKSAKELNGFGIALGLNNCELKSIGDIFALKVDATVEISGTVHVEEFDIKAKNFIFSHEISVKPTGKIGAEGALKRQPEIKFAAYSINFVTPVGVVVPLDISFGIQFSYESAVAATFTSSGTYTIKSGRIGIRGGKIIPATTPITSVEALKFDPDLNVSAKVKMEPYVAIGIGKTIGAGTVIDLAKVRLLAGIQAEAGSAFSLGTGDFCQKLAVGFIVEADFTPAEIELAGISIFDRSFTFLSYSPPPFYPTQPPECALSPATYIDVIFPYPQRDATTVTLGEAALTMEAKPSFASNDPITSYAWSIVGIDTLSGILLDGANTAVVNVIPHGLKPGQVVKVKLEVTSLLERKASKIIQIVGNVPPTVAGTITLTGNSLVLDPSLSSDSDGKITMAKWAFSDGRTLIRQRGGNAVTLDRTVISASALTRPITAYLTVYDDAGSTSTVQVVGSVVPAPTITFEPKDISVEIGQSASFSVSASGFGLLTYQWQRNGVPISGAITASYSIPAVALTDSGNAYSVIVSSAAGATMSRAVHLTVSASIVVQSATCTSPVFAAVMTCTIVGNNLPTNMSMTATNCSPSTMAELTGGTSARRQFTCSPSAIGGLVSIAYVVPGFIGALPPIRAEVAIASTAFYDSFEGSVLDTTKWMVSTATTTCCGPGNPAVIDVSGGYLNVAVPGGSCGACGVGDGSLLRPVIPPLGGDFEITVSAEEIERLRRDNHSALIVLALELNGGNATLGVYIRGDVKGNTGVAGHSIELYSNVAGALDYLNITELTVGRYYSFEFRVRRVGSDSFIAFRLANELNWTEFIVRQSIAASVAFSPKILFVSGDGSGTIVNSSFKSRLGSVTIK